MPLERRVGFPPQQGLAAHTPPTAHSSRQQQQGVLVALGTTNKALSEKSRTAAQLTHRKLRFLFIVGDRRTQKENVDIQI